MGQLPDELETQVAQELFNLEMSAADIKTQLRDLYVTAAKEVHVGNSQLKAIIIFVPYRLLEAYHKIQTRLVRELEKKFSGRHVVIVAQRTILESTSPGVAQPKLWRRGWLPKECQKASSPA